MVKLVSSKIQKDYKRLINDLIKDIADEEITIYSPSTIVKCPNCIFDPITKKSSGQFDSSFVAPITIFVGTDSERTINPKSFTRGRCPICFGQGVLEAENKTVIKASIDFWPEAMYQKQEEYVTAPYGRDGKSYIILKAHEKHYSLLLNCLYVDYNGVRYEKTRPPVYTGIGINALVSAWFVQVGTDAVIG